MTHIHLVRQSRLEVIAQTVVEGELWRDLPLVLNEEPVIAVVQVHREVFLLLGQIRIRPAISGQPLDDTRSEIDGRAQRRRLKCDWNAVRGIRGIRTGNSRKGRKKYRRKKCSTDRRKSHRAWSGGNVGRNPSRRAHEIGEINETIDAGHNDSDRREPRPQHVIADVIDVRTETNEVLSINPG